jgi:hypothetical protein
VQSVRCCNQLALIDPVCAPLQLPLTPSPLHTDHRSLPSDTLLLPHAYGPG